MSLIDVSHLTFYYDGSYDMIFEDVSFQADTDWKLGFIGRNGRGKTTFLKLLMGELEYRGSIHSQEEFAYFPYPVQDRSRNAAEAAEECCPGGEFWKLCRELNLLDADPEVLLRPFETLSFGEQTKVMLAALFSGEERFLLIDEPTNHLDREGRTLVQEYLKKKKGFLLVSHDRAFLDGCVDHVLVLNKQSIEVRQGNFSAWWTDKQNRDAFERAENEKLQREIGRLQAAARKSGAWADRAEGLKTGTGTKGEINGKFIGTRAYLGEKSRRLQQRRKNLERRQQAALEDKKGLLKNIETAAPLKIVPLRHYKEVLVKCDDVSLSYAPRPEAAEGQELTAGRPLGGRPAPAHFNMELKNGCRISLQGRNGCGKSSVLKAVLSAAGAVRGGMDFLCACGDGGAQLCQPAGRAGSAAGPVLTGGRIETAAGLILSYVPQDPSFLKGDLKDFAVAYGLEESLFKALLRKLDFSREQFDKDMADFSAGQKKKVLLARSLCEQAHLYLWDEPLNYVDVFSRMQIEELLLEFRPAMLFVEHDRAFTEKIATETIEI